MNQNNRFCSQQSHEQSEVYHICTYRWCYKSRWCCSLCLTEKIHDHQISKNHIINLADLPDKVKQDIENLKKDQLNSQKATQIKNLLSQMVKETQELEQNIIQLRQDLQRQLNNLISDDDNFNLQSLLNSVEEQNFFQLNDEDINKLMMINEYRFSTNGQFQFQDKLDKIKQQLAVLQENLEDLQEEISNNNYGIQQIYERDNNKKGYIQSSTINKKQQYLVYSVENITRINDIKIKKMYKRIISTRILEQLQFTKDSKYLFAIAYQGFVYGYFVLNGFKIFYQQQIHQKHITQIIIQKQYLITASYDKTIIKTDFITKTQIFKLVGHLYMIYNIDYDIQKDILISTSDQTIKVWDCANQSILVDYANDTNYELIQLINNNQDVICKIDRELWKFTIDYENKQLVKFPYYEDEQFISGFYQVNDDQILVICEEYTKILNKKMELTHMFQNTISLSSNKYLLGNYNKTILRYLDNLNNIILQDNYSLSLLRVKNWN